MAQSIQTTSLIVQGVDITVRRAGSGPPVLYLHDELSSDWNAHCDALSGGADVLSAELPGFGTTDRPDTLDGLDDMAFFVADLIEAAAAEAGADVAVVGSSLGGWLAAEAAIRGARGLSALALVGAPGPDLSGDPPADYFILAAGERDALFFNDVAKAPEVDEDAMIRNAMTTARLVWQPRYASPALLNRLHRVRVPALIIWGADDRFLSRAHADAWARALPDAQLTVINGSGHFPVWEQPDALAAAITSFLGEG